jgi:hypothetical protein
VIPTLPTDTTRPARRVSAVLEILPPGSVSAVRDAIIAATEQRAGAASQAMITDESLTVSEAVHWCAGAIGHREAARLRRLTAQAHNNDEPENDSTMAADIR